MRELKLIGRRRHKRQAETRIGEHVVIRNPLVVTIGGHYVPLGVKMEPDMAPHLPGQPGSKERIEFLRQYYEKDNWGRSPFEA